MRRLIAAAFVFAMPLIGAPVLAQSSKEAIQDAATRHGLDINVATTADALGMIRLAGAAQSLDLINRLEFVANGKMYTPARGSAPWAETQVKSLTYGVSTHLPAARADIVMVGPGGVERREIHVVRENLAWNETEPGVGGAPAQASLAERQRQILLLPHGFMRAVLQADPKAVAVATEGGKKTYTVTVNDVPVKGTMAGDRLRPERIEMPIQHPVLGRTVLASNYPEYKDWEGYEVWFPSRIVQTLGDRTVADLTITKYMTGPYLVWPVPANVRAVASR